MPDLASDRKKSNHHKLIATIPGRLDCYMVIVRTKHLCSQLEVLQALRPVAAWAIDIPKTHISVIVDISRLWYNMLCIQASPISTEMTGVPALIRDSIHVFFRQCSFEKHFYKRYVQAEPFFPAVVEELDLNMNTPTSREVGTCVQPASIDGFVALDLAVIGINSLLQCCTLLMPVRAEKKLLASCN